MLEDEQVYIFDWLGDECVVDIFDQMEFDDVVDLLVQFDLDCLEQFFEFMELEEVEDVCMLLWYGLDIVGGLMMLELIILLVDVIVVEVFVFICCYELYFVFVVVVFVMFLLFEMLMGCLFGMVYFQWMLCYLLYEWFGVIMDDSFEFVLVMVFVVEVVCMLVSYDFVLFLVIDVVYCLVGVISVDDVFDYLLLDDWCLYDVDDVFFFVKDVC